MGSPDSLGNHKPVLILFDGVCNLCNGLVQFIIRRDAKGKFKFASLQSEVGRSLLKQFNIDPDLLHSIVVIDNEHLRMTPPLRDCALRNRDAGTQIQPMHRQPDELPGHQISTGIPEQRTSAYRAGC